MKFPARTVSALAVWVLAAAFASSQTTAPDGAVFSMTNATAGNEIVVFDRSFDGTLTLTPTTYATTGMGTGAALGSQGALATGRNINHRWLAAVNAGSGDVSLFEIIGTSTLQLTDMVPSGGDNPVSVAIHDDVLYVLNAGNPNNITGFTISAQGMLTQIPNSTQPLSAATTNPSQVGWSPDGQLLVVTEKDTDQIDLFTVDTSTNLATAMFPQPSSGPAPFGFRFRGPRQLLVSEAATGQTDASSLSSYALLAQALTVIDGSIPTTETNARWIVSTKNRKFAYTANTGSDSISGFATNAYGHLTLLNVDGVTATTGNKPADMATAKQSRYLYVLNSADGTISIFKVNRATGALTSIGSAVAGLPTVGAAGLLAF
jgi:6-phosphogluconolactonase